MTFWQFVFFFLYKRNWNNGSYELSRERLSLFCAGLFFILLGLLLVTVMQRPVLYEASVTTVSS